MKRIGKKGIGLPTPDHPPASLAEALLQTGLVTETQLAQARELQRKDPKPLGMILVTMGLLSEEDIAWTYARQFKIPYISLVNLLIDPVLFRLIPGEIARRHALVPISRKGDKLYLAMVEPLDVPAIDLVGTLTGLEIKPVASTPTDIHQALLEGYGMGL